MDGEQNRMATVSHDDLHGVHARIDKVETSLERFTSETFPQFTANLLSQVGEKFDTFAQRVERGRPNFFSIATLVGGAITIAITILGGYGKLALDQNSSNITRLEHALEQQGTNLDEAAHAFDLKLDKLNAAFELKLDNLSTRTMPYNEVKLRTDSNSQAIANVQKYLYEDDKVIRKDVFNEYTKRIDENQRNLLEGMRRFVDKTTEGFGDIRGKLVSRSENEYHWSTFDKAMTQFQSSLDQLRRDSSSGYSVNDQLKNLQSQLNQEQQLITQLLASQLPATKDGK